MRHYESALERGTKVTMTARSGYGIATGTVVEDDGRFVYLEECSSLSSDPVKSEVVADRRVHVLEATGNPTSNQSDTAADTSPNDPEEQDGGDMADVEPEMTPSRPKPKSSLGEDDVERLLMKVGETALAGLKSMGLKSGAIYPLMIKINAALKAALSTSSKD
jgi:hypothetical protein